MISLVLGLLILNALPYCQCTLQPLPSDIHSPTQYVDTLPLKQFDRIGNQTFVSSIPIINYQINSRMYYKKGAVPDEHLYNHYYYTTTPNLNPIKGSSGNNAENQTNPCSLFPTTVQSYWSIGMTLNTNSIDQLLFIPVINQQNLNQGDWKTAGHLFVYIEKEKSLAVIQVSVVDLHDSKTGQYQQTKIERVKNVDVDNLELTNFRIFDINNELYVIKNNTMYRYRTQGPQTIKLTGEVVVDQQTRDVGFMKKNGPDQIIFYVATVSNIEIYEINTQKNNVQKVKDFQQIFTQQHIELFSATYDPTNQLFYLTAENAMYTLTNENEQNRITEAYILNGTCQFNGNYETTMHLICYYRQIVYGLELHFNKNNITLNRYYTDWDIQGIHKMINIGHQKMVILGTNSFLLQGYAINRNILLELDKYQSFDIVKFPKGQFIAPIPILSDDHKTTLLTISEDQQLIIGVTTLKQDPPELYCQFQEDEEDLEYSILMEFNVSKCNREPTKKKGSLQAFCTIFQPYKIRNTPRSKYIEPKGANIISGVIIICGVIIGLVVVGLGALVIKKLGNELDVVRQKTKQARLKKISKQLRQMDKL